MASEHYEPKGLRFLDRATNREMILVGEGEHYAGWLCYRHPDGQWVTLREATEADRAALTAQSDAVRVATGFDLRALFPVRTEGSVS